MKKTFTISIIINFLFMFFGGYVIHKKGGIGYLKIRLKSNTDTISTNHRLHYYTKNSFFESMPNDTNEVIFLGNSITEMCDWNELFRKKNIKNRGINGDIINGVIDRLDEVVSSSPKRIFLMIGTNDLGLKIGVNQIIADYEKLVKLILSKTPETTLYLQSILPTKNQQRRRNKEIVEINNGIRDIAQKNSLIYIDLFDSFKTKDNELNMDLSFDGLHLNGQGYLLWKNAIINYVEN